LTDDSHRCSPSQSSLEMKDYRRIWAWLLPLRVVPRYGLGQVHNKFTRLFCTPPEPQRRQVSASFGSLFAR